MTEPSLAPARLGYQPALDGVRAFAVVAVLLYHENIGRGVTYGILPGGFLGVDVFFVLSGFLITGILLAGHARRGRMVSVDFWARRARRLLPALFVLLALVAVYAAVVAPTYARADIRRESVAALFYVSNWVAIIRPSPQITPLSQLWSLAVEEQWYLVWPLLLAGLVTFTHGRRGRLLGAVLLLAAASFGWMVTLYLRSDALHAAAGTDARAWQLLIGGAFAIAIAGRPPALGRRAALALDGSAIVAAAFLAWAVVSVRQTTPWLIHGGLGIVGLATIVILAAAINPTGPLVRRVLAWRPLVAIGLISYGLYLYHLLVYSWLTKERLGVGVPLLLVIRLGVLFALAAASYRWLERPVRLGRFRWSRQWLTVPAAGAVVLGVVLVGTRGSTPAPLATVALTQYRHLASTTPPGYERVLVAGDETAFAMGWALEPPIDRSGIRGAVAGTVGCGIAPGTPVIGTRPVARPPCPDWQKTYSDAVEAFRPEVTVLMLGGAEVFDRQVDGAVLRVGTNAWRRELLARLEAARRALGVGRPLLLVAVPCAVPVDPAAAAEGAVRSDPHRIDAVNTVFADYAATHRRRVRLVSVDPVLCPAGDPHPTLGGRPLRPDGVTVSAVGADALWNWLAPTARQAATPR